MALINLLTGSSSRLVSGTAASGLVNQRQVLVMKESPWEVPVVRVSSEKAQKIILTPQNQRSLEQEMFTNENPPYTSPPGYPLMENANSNLEMSQSQSNQSLNRRLPMGSILLLVSILIGAFFTALVIKRRQELARWREYRTHQILQAQDEAFDTNYDEAFDLELVEGSSQIMKS